MKTPTEPSMPEDRPLTLADMQTWPQGMEVRLYYHSTNKGDFMWRHDHVEGDRVFGQFRYDEYMVYGEAGWSKVHDILYEFEGVVCRGSGAEPVWLVEPPPPAAETDEEFEDPTL